MNDRNLTSPHLDWELVPRHFREPARRAYAHRLTAETLAPLSPVDRLPFVERNAEALVEDGLYEEMLYTAWITGPRSGWAERLGRRLFARADRSRLRALGQPLPGPRRSYTLYRAAGLGEKSNSEFGVEWTLSLDTATRSLLAEDLGHPVDDLAIYTAEVGADEILLYLNRRGEARVVVDTGWSTPPRRDPTPPEPFRARVLTRIGLR